MTIRPSSSRSKKVEVSHKIKNGTLMTCVTRGSSTSVYLNELKDIEIEGSDDVTGREIGRPPKQRFSSCPIDRKSLKEQPNSGIIAEKLGEDDKNNAIARS